MQTFHGNHLVHLAVSWWRPLPLKGASIIPLPETDVQFFFSPHFISSSTLWFYVAFVCTELIDLVGSALCSHQKCLLELNCSLFSHVPSGTTKVSM